MKRQAVAMGTVLTVAGLAISNVEAREYHVAVTGDDGNAGSPQAPLKTISEAARRAQPGDVVTVHAGTYRERIAPPRGGASDQQRITYQAAKGEKVVIKGSEVVKGWQRVQHDTWKVELPNDFFGHFNPYRDVIHGDWFNPKGREHHTGAVYRNGHWLTEAAKRDEVLQPAGDAPLWFGQVDDDHTTIWAQFKGADPNREPIEINVRQTVFYPEKPSIDYITVRGFTMAYAAIDTVISDNHIYRTCRGIWLDWMAQGTRVTRNLLHDNDGSQDLFFEVDHGPFLVDHNICLSWFPRTSSSHWQSRHSVLDVSEGGAYAHNLFLAGVLFHNELRRDTPFMEAHSTAVAGLRNVPGGDDRKVRQRANRNHTET